jgi:hypothetical protein
MLSGAQAQARGFSADYDGSPGVTVSVPKPSQAMQYGPDATARIQAHNDRAAQLAAGREDRQRQAIGGMTHDERRGQLRQGIADRHEIALANLGVPGHADPRRMDVNPFVQAGQSVAGGVGSGVQRGAKLAVDPISVMSRMMQNRFRKDNGINSPATVYAGYSANIPGGVAAGVAGNVGVAVGAVTGMSDAMRGPANDQSLQLGYTYGQNIVTGFRSALKTDLFQASGTPNIAGEQARTALGKQGLLGPGAGASVYKTPAVSFGGPGVAAQLAAVVKASQGTTKTMQPIVINLDGQPFRKMIAESLADFVEQLRDSSFGANG